MSPGKSYLFLQNFEKALLENLICSYGNSFSWKILCVLTKFWTRSPGNFDLFLWNFEKALLEILMCSSTFCLSWKIYMCSYKRIMSSSEKLEVFLLHPSLMENLMCSQEISLKKVAPGK